MRKRFLPSFWSLALAALGVCAPAHGAHISFDLADFVTDDLNRRRFTLTPQSTPRTNGTTIITSDAVNYVTGTNGTHTVSNMVEGVYQVDILGRTTTTTFLIDVPSTNALLDASTLLTTTNSVSAETVAYTKSQADGRFVQLLNSWASNIVVTNLTIDGATNAFRFTNGAVSGHVLTTDGTNWFSAAAPGAGGGEANTSSNLGTESADIKHLAAPKSGVDNPIRSIGVTNNMRIAATNGNTVFLESDPTRPEESWEIYFASSVGVVSNIVNYVLELPGSNVVVSVPNPTNYTRYISGKWVSHPFYIWPNDDTTFALTNTGEGSSGGLFERSGQSGTQTNYMQMSSNAVKLLAVPDSLQWYVLELDKRAEGAGSGPDTQYYFGDTASGLLAHETNTYILGDSEIVVTGANANNSNTFTLSIASSIARDSELPVPGNPDGSMQYNSGGAFAGATNVVYQPNGSLWITNVNGEPVLLVADQLGAVQLSGTNLGTIYGADFYFTVLGINAWKLDNTSGDFVPALDSALNIGNPTTRVSQAYFDLVDSLTLRGGAILASNTLTAPVGDSADVLPTADGRLAVVTNNADLMPLLSFNALDTTNYVPSLHVPPAAGNDGNAVVYVEANNRFELASSGAGDSVTVNGTAVVDPDFTNKVALLSANALGIDFHTSGNDIAGEFKFDPSQFALSATTNTLNLAGTLDMADAIAPISDTIYPTNDWVLVLSANSYTLSVEFGTEPNRKFLLEVQNEDAYSGLTLDVPADAWRLNNGVAPTFQTNTTFWVLFELTTTGRTNVTLIDRGLSMDFHANYNASTNAVDGLITLGSPTATASPAGSDTEVQFNDGGATGAEAAFAYTKADDTLTVSNIVGAFSNTLTKIFMPELTADRALYYHSTLGITNSAAVTSTELEYLDGVTSGIQGQINGKQASDAGLTSVAAIGAGSGYVRQTAEDTFALGTTSANLAADITDESGTGLLILQTSPTIITPTIASFANANHDHADAAGGGQIAYSDLTGTPDLTVTNAYLPTNGGSMFGTFNLTNVSELLLPMVDAAPSSEGEFLMDTNTTIGPLLSYWFGGVQFYVVATTNLGTDDQIAKVNAGLLGFEADAGAAGGDDVSVNGSAVVGADFDDATPAAPANAANVVWQTSGSGPADISAHVLYNGNQLTDASGTIGIVDRAFVTNMTAWTSFVVTNATPDRVAVINGANQLTNSAGVTVAELEYLATTTSDVQVQLDAKQASDGDLTAIAGLAANGLIARTATDTMAVRTISESTTTLTITDGDGVAGNPTFGVDSDVEALAGIAANGIVARTSAGNISARTITEGAGIDVANGDGVSGNPTITLEDRYAYEYFNAAAWLTNTTDGATYGTVQEATDRLAYDYLAFANSASNAAVIAWVAPEDWDRSTVKFKVHWSSTVASGAVVWELSAVAVGNDDALNATFGTAQTATDTQTAASDLLLSPATAALTVGGTPTAGDVVFIKIRRLTDHASDTLAGEARVHDVWLQYVRSGTEASAW